jgi:phenylacetaldehyde dehydrogenase
VTGTGPEAGEALVDDPDVACIAFTGSTAVGQRIAERAGRQRSSSDSSSTHGS